MITIIRLIQIVFVVVFVIIVLIRENCHLVKIDNKTWPILFTAEITERIERLGFVFVFVIAICI